MCDWTMLTKCNGICPRAEARDTRSVNNDDSGEAEVDASGQERRSDGQRDQVS